MLWSAVLLHRESFGYAVSHTFRWPGSFARSESVGSVWSVVVLMVKIVSFSIHSLIHMLLSDP